jgi:hypothetical protein
VKVGSIVSSDIHSVSEMSLMNRVSAGGLSNPQMDLKSPGVKVCAFTCPGTAPADAEMPIHKSSVLRMNTSVMG